MRHIKLYENFFDIQNKYIDEDETDQDKDLISDLFLEYSDKYEIRQVDDIWGEEYRDVSVFDIEVSITKIPMVNRMLRSYLLSIKFDDFFGLAGDDEGFLSERFEKDMEKYVGRLKLNGFRHVEIDWEGGIMYQISIRR